MNELLTLDKLMAKLDAGESWESVRGEAINFLYTMQRNLHKQTNAALDAQWKLTSLREQLFDLAQGIKT